MTDKETTVEGLSEAQVVEYLRQHPGFFVDHDYLLREIRVPHDSGRAISLVERQVQVFREQRDQLQRELGNLIAIARENDRFFEKSKRLLINLIEAKSLEEVVIMIEESVRNDFGLDCASLLLFGDPRDYPVSNIQVLPLEEAEAILGEMIHSKKAICGRLQPRQSKCLFPMIDTEIGSAAVISLHNTEHLGMFSLGSHDQSYFDRGMGSLFLSYISDTMSRLLPPLLSQEKSRASASATT
ncbi:MAG: DUF484 family protein [Pseudomonadales bacterium]|nr:DUF484 family protein [Pseudomonadales bacterium]